IRRVGRIRGADRCSRQSAWLGEGAGVSGQGRRNGVSTIVYILDNGLLDANASDQVQDSRLAHADGLLDVEIELDDVTTGGACVVRGGILRIDAHAHLAYRQAREGTERGSVIQSCQKRANFNVRADWCGGIDVQQGWIVLE